MGDSKKPTLASQIPKEWQKTRAGNVVAEYQFKKWLESTEWAKQLTDKINGERAAQKEPPISVRQFINKEADSPDGDYDYRAAYNAGITPQPYEHDNGQYHWPSKTPDGKWLKSPTHPTAWKEVFFEQTGKNPDELGIRSIEDGDAYIQQPVAVPQQ